MKKKKLKYSTERKFKKRNDGHSARHYCLFPFFSSTVPLYAYEEKNGKYPVVLSTLRQPVDFIDRLKPSHNVKAL